MINLSTACAAGLCGLYNGMEKQHDHDKECIQHEELKKRMAAILSAGTLAMTGTVSALSGWSASADATFSYGDALKMSLYFMMPTSAVGCREQLSDMAWRLPHLRWRGISEQCRRTLVCFAGCHQGGQRRKRYCRCFRRLPRCWRPLEILCNHGIFHRITGMALL